MVQDRRKRWWKQPLFWKNTISLAVLLIICVFVYSTVSNTIDRENAESRASNAQDIVKQANLALSKALDNAKLAQAAAERAEDAARAAQAQSKTNGDTLTALINENIRLQILVTALSQQLTDAGITPTTQSNRGSPSPSPGLSPTSQPQPHPIGSPWPSPKPSPSPTPQPTPSHIVCVNQPPLIVLCVG